MLIDRLIAIKCPVTWFLISRETERVNSSHSIRLISDVLTVLLQMVFDSCHTDYATVKTRLAELESSHLLIQFYAHLDRI